MAHEGLPFAGAALLLTVLCWLGAHTYPALGYAAVAGGVLAAFMVYFFRDPSRTAPMGAGLIVSAADGKVVAVEPLASCEYLDGPAVQVSVFLSVFDVHVNRVPMEGVVDLVRFQKGRFLAAFVAAASTENEQRIVAIRSGSTRIVVKQIVGIVARRIVCRVQEGEAVRRGQRYGLIRFGSRVDLILPGRTVLRVQVGDRVRAGETVIGAIADV